MSNTDGEQAADHEQGPLDWMRENREQVEALADSDLRTADAARAGFEYRDSDGQ